MHQFLDLGLARFYNSEVLATLPTHYLNVNSFSKDKCAELVKIFDQSASEKSTVYTEDPDLAKFQAEQQFRTSSLVQVNDDLIKELDDRLDFVVQYHTGKILKPLTGKIEGSQILKYEARNSGHFSMHTDNAFIDSAGAFKYTNPQRAITTITILNEDYEGGELALGFMIDHDHRPLIMKPEAGTTIIFPADLRFPHQVLPVSSGVRYSMVKWYGFA